jgi:hypothetical protein
VLITLYDTKLNQVQTWYLSDGNSYYARLGKLDISNIFFERLGTNFQTSPDEAYCPDSNFAGV